MANDVYALNDVYTSYDGAVPRRTRPAREERGSGARATAFVGEATGQTVLSIARRGGVAVAHARLAGRAAGHRLSGECPPPTVHFPGDGRPACHFERGGIMCTDMPRRDFLKSTPAAFWMLAQTAHSLSAQTGGALPATAPGAVEPTTVSPAVTNAIEAFDYHGVTLHASRVKAQFDLARSYYLSISNDDILKGFRAAAGLPAPGTTLGGWCARNSNTVFGQWLSGMSRMYRATGDTAIRDKAATLMAEFTKTVKPNGDAGMNHYPYEKLVCGLVDMKVYGDHPEAIALLDNVTSWAEKNLDRARVPATPAIWFGRPNEWYTLAENLYRAHLVTGEPRYKTFAEVWLYPQYWNKFAAASDPK